MSIVFVWESRDFCHISEAANTFCLRSPTPRQTGRTRAGHSSEDGRPFVLRVSIDSSDTFLGLYNKVESEGAADIVPLGNLRNYTQEKSNSEQPPIFFRFAAYEAPATSQDYPANTFETTDLVLNLAPGNASGETELGAYYNQRLVSSARVATILSRIDFMTESKFRGAIHDIFAENAEKHPDRPCVVETKPGSFPHREFTYRQINEASNILAHHLVQSGIQRGEVVMAYAYRGVDLMVAVMGILKAGATFFVIDPAYPPERQNIYLDVARPRALVVIEKATRDAGELSETVRTFIRENLELWTEVPALSLRDDGSLLGSSVDGKDVFADQVCLKSKPVGVVVGPDSIPTLSFTSGSEGRPKDVRGRHFSLAYYFPWMAENFSLSNNDKFTMLRAPVQQALCIDKPALLFPDTVELSAVAPLRRSSVLQALSETEQALAQIWASRIPNVTANMIGPDDSFFDLGGHSILAQQMFFDLRRKWRGINFNMSAIFRSPTLRGFAAEIGHLVNFEQFASNDDKGTAGAASGASNEPDDAYSKDARALVDSLLASFPERTESILSSEPIIFLNGATGFLGAHILRDLLTRKSPEARVVTFVRSTSEDQALERIRSTCRAYGFWNGAWTSRLQCVCGDLGKPQFGLSESLWENLTNRLGAVIHNGALVHWVYPYSTPKPANVLGTIDALKLCGSGKAKQFCFVSSTSALDMEHYVQESENALVAGKAGISEEDDLEGSAVGLGTGYGQSKWADEYLVREVGRRGLKGTIVRPGHVLGDSTTGTTNTDDFLIRMLKGCTQLNSRPNINNTVNMLPVDHVARVIVASAFQPPRTPISVAQVTGHPRLRFNQFLGALQLYRHDDPGSQHALMPLYHFVTSDLPSNTKAPELDDANAAAALRADAAWSGINASAGTGEA
ncbi:L-aminoadipate-semialdehyde dehydrogenase [Aspergillus glaucus CBS 516.65]|uniref:Carrier domain-containing protein n=1 Tax=Aspergillus glaucus CBS 516.65 TaxID=1160497 RepID=A0A1L9V5H1_ASPGL|nr:hypothetical protein ASPGLDRAFT_30060 [Aspergillus glaucus CBS 516.65]OJJ79156.1 hypothetical protein ASPGLDRAFT_30060 [Aspergillus glaucus CBS 516.65]